MLCSKSYDPVLHKSFPEDEVEPFRSDVTFIGAWTPYKESELVRVLEALPHASVQVRGPNWQRKTRSPLLRARLGVIPGGVFGITYGRALAGARVGLGLLAWDLAPEEVITDRILEIPACGALLLAPRTEAIAAIFKDGEEALLFGSPGEMIERLRWALDHEEERAAIARRGQARVQAGPFRNTDIVRSVLRELFTVSETP
jgi:glycosyltransferase involved in cell wall biosynthesis